MHRSEIVPDAYVFCTSESENDPDIRARFGEGCVRINDAEAFFQIVHDALKANVPGTLPDGYLQKVDYSVRKTTYKLHTNTHPAFIKPPGPPQNFEIEREVRAVWLPEGLKISPIVLHIPSVCCLLERVS